MATAQLLCWLMARHIYYDYYYYSCCCCCCCCYHYYLPCHKVGVAGNILMLRTMHGIVPVSAICLSVLNISGMDEATLIKFGNWIKYG